MKELVCSDQTVALLHFSTLRAHYVNEIVARKTLSQFLYELTGFFLSNFERYVCRSMEFVHCIVLFCGYGFLFYLFTQFGRLFLVYYKPVEKPETYRHWLVEN